MTTIPVGADDRLPMVDVGWSLDNTFATDVPELHVEWQPASVPEPELVTLNADLARELGTDPGALTSSDGVAVLAGNATPVGSRPTAMAYAGHQFGGFSPRLGDGRALLLGEVTGVDGRLLDIHLKGSGRTPFSRGGDGRAELGPMLREFLVAEAMHALNIPTARALAVVSTGQDIERRGNVPGAVLTRVAASHIRVGTFEYAARLGDIEVVRRLADHSIQRHYAGISDDGRYLAFLDAVVGAQASLVAEWMLVGFIHGVMNTDNVTVSGESIDYGPCAFMDRYDPKTVFSSIDHGGRYAFGNQPEVNLWNLARLAETLLPLIDSNSEHAVTAATEVLDTYTSRFGSYWLNGMRTKLGLVDSEAADESLVGELLDLLRVNSADYTSTFRHLARSLRGDDDGRDASFGVLGGGGGWVEKWNRRLGQEGRDRETVADEMDRVNPAYVPRNHLVEAALDAATSGDFEPFNALLAAVTAPFEERSDLARFAEPAPEGFDGSFTTYCGT